jgi:hypothetical protein
MAMIRRKEGGQGNKSTQNSAVLDCAVCHCPNKLGSAKCMYCGAPLPLPGRFKMPDFTKLRGFFSRSEPAYPESPIIKIVSSILLAGALFLGGSAFLYRAFNNGGYLNWAMTLLLGFYGSSLLRNAHQIFYKKKPN